MVDFVENYDFISAVRPHIEEIYGQENLVNCCRTPKIIGQERDGMVIYTWHSKETCNNFKSKTHVSLYDTEKRKSALLFTHNDDIDIVNASVNQNNILLAFTVREVQPLSGNMSPGDPTEIFKSYIAEIAPCNRIFSLNIEWHTYQKVQFLYSPKPQTKKIPMLFIHHKESIGLYHIPVGKLGDAGYVMSSQPKTEQIVQQFLWCQFDPTTQRLFFLQLIAKDEEGMDAVAMFNAIQFTDPGEFKYMLKFQLPLSLKMELMKETVKYFPSYLSQVASNRNLNITALVGSKGELTVCYQHVTNDSAAASSDKSSPSSDNDDTISVCSIIPGCNTIEYSICCVHGGYTIHAVVSVASTSHEMRLFFTNFGEYILVLLPGEFMHLLDCSSEHKPMHHILLSQDNFSALPEESSPSSSTKVSSTKSLLSQVHWDYYNPSSQNGMLFFENHSQKMYRASFNHKMLATLFSKTRHSITRLAVLHSAIVHIRESSLVKKLVECLCQDPANVECTELLKEYLIAFAYANMKKLLNKQNVLKALPISFSEPFRGQMERDRDNERAIIVTYKNFRRDIVDVLLRLLRGCNDDYWCALKENISLSRDENVKRFPIKQLAYVGLKVSQPHPPPLLLPKKTAVAKGTPELRRRAESRLSTRRGSYPHKKDDSRQSTLNDVQSQDEAVVQVLVEKLSGHMVQCFPRENKGKIHNICLEYATCRAKVVKSFWRHVSKVLDYNPDDSDALKVAPLGPTATKSSDHALFQMLERLHACISQLSYPEFRDMSNVFISLAYRCLPLHLFMQYLHASVFTVRPDFVQRFVAQVRDDVADIVSVKIELLSRLPKHQAKAILCTWNHPAAERFVTNELVSRYDGEGMSALYNTEGFDSNRGRTGSAEPMDKERFLPLETFLRVVRSDERHWGPYRLSEYEMNYIESSAVKQMDFLSIVGYKY
eukprot:gene14283-15770_t